MTSFPFHPLIPHWSSLAIIYPNHPIVLFDSNTWPKRQVRRNQFESQLALLTESKSHWIIKKIMAFSRISAIWGDRNVSVRVSEEPAWQFSLLRFSNFQQVAITSNALKERHENCIVYRYNGTSILRTSVYVHTQCEFRRSSNWLLHTQSDLYVSMGRIVLTRNKRKEIRELIVNKKKIMSRPYATVLPDL